MSKVGPMLFALLLATSLACAGTRELPPELGPEVLRDLQTALRCAAVQGHTTSTVAGVIDFSLASDQRRLWVVDLQDGRVLFHERVAHGSGSGGRFATRFGDEEGSHRSSLGLYRTGRTYHGKHGRSLRLDGLEPSNAHARDRAIVIHAADYVTDSFVREHGRAGRSWGCPALDPAVAQQVIDDLPQGTLLLAWHPDEAWRASSPFLGCDAP